MHHSRRVLPFLLLAICASLPLNAGILPYTKIADPIITAVSSTSITVTHQKAKMVKRSRTIETITETFQVTPFTDISINGKKAKVDDLSEGMSVIITADPPLIVDSTKAPPAGVARSIAAHPVSAKKT